MKNMNNPTWKTGGMALMLFCTLLTSCSNEELLGEKNPVEDCNTICFGLANYAEPITKSSIDASGSTFTANQFVLRSDQSADTLCLRAVISDGINSSPSTTQQPLTRGVPVTGISDFYDKFHVLAYWKSDNTLMNTFFMNEDASSNAQNVWQTDRIYYWPGSNHTLQFYAWAPIDVQGFVSPSTPQSMDCTYTVPAVASEQKDILVASTSEISGNNNAAVPLQFEHVCTQIRFVVGSEMQPGTIQSVTLKSVAGSGTYSMSNNTWTLNAAVTDFTQQLNLRTTGSEVDGTDITTTEGTFMMLPQTFASDSPAQVEVVFINENQETRTLTACIAGSQWPMGKTVTYKLSISPEYELKFVSEPEYQDAHYVIYPITIKASRLCDGNFTLKSSNPAICKLRDRLIGPEVQGYWPKETAAQGDFARTESITSSTESSEVTYYAFLTENITEVDRDVTLELQYNGKTITTLTIRQKCPNWMTDGSMGWEYIEEDGEKPFGFAWTRKVTYKSNNGLAGLLISLLRLFGVIQSNPAVSFSGLINVTCTIDYSKVQALSNVFSDTDGLANTKGFSANSASDLSSLENTLGYLCTISSETGDNINSTDFAALVCIKKNACDVEKQEQGTQVVYLPQFTDADIKWYLPARNQFTEGVGLEGQYWSSTAIDNNQNAYSWQGAYQSTPRMENHKVRAVRIKE